MNAATCHRCGNETDEDAAEADRVPGMVETSAGVMVRHDRAPRWWAQLWGGWSYTWGDEAEPFETLADVVEEYRRRRCDPYFPTWGDADVPAVGETTRVGLIWRHAGETDGADVAGAYPDATLELGPRGGLRVVPA